MRAIPSASRIVLNWDDVPEDDLWYYQVECKNASGNFVSVAVVYDKRGVELTNLQPETVYTYRVRAIDLLGNVGEVSDEISVTTIDDTTAPVITSLGPVSSRYGNSINLRATIYDNVSAVSEVFQISRDNINWTDIKYFDR
ncbi:fibronectin type III domain-containing protein [Acetivibrio straminisolvens]|uniref:fibronectin type III domain-containing protein n=1 Tax=Acetivibrio straminisolvens TaxID=253314 RepID=UPI000570F482